MTAPTMDELYPEGDNFRYHLAHQPYIVAVSRALDAVGFTVLDWYADANDPRDGAIQISPVGAYAGYDEVWVGWQEERGWHILAVDDERDSRMVFDTSAGVLFSPWSVADEVASMAGIIPPPLPDDGHPDLDFPGREQTDEDVAFELALRHYAEVT